MSVDSNAVGADAAAAAAASNATSAAASMMPPPNEIPPTTTTTTTASNQQQQPQRQPAVLLTAITSAAALSSSSSSLTESRNSFKRTHKREISAGTKSTMLWLKASEEYAEERRRRADLPPCVSADDVVDDILQEFDQVKNSTAADRRSAEISGLKLSDVQ